MWVITSFAPFGALMEKRPSGPVWTASLPPFTCTVAPLTAESAVMTRPVTVMGDWAKPVMERIAALKMRRNRSAWARLWGRWGELAGAPHGKHRFIKQFFSLLMAILQSISKLKNSID
jgi:hypothetical protein